MAVWRIIPVFVALLGLASGEDSITISATCPDECHTSLGEAFTACVPFSNIGCIMQACTDTAGFQCVPNTGGEPGLVLTPGGDIVIDKLRVNDFFKFQVDLKVPPLETDFYLLSDATGSMGSAIATAKRKFRELVAFFDKIDTKTNFGVGFFRDESELVDGFKNVQPLTEDRSAVEAAINTLRATGGGDADEANLSALYKVATDAGIGWRSNSRKIVVYFGDNPGHEPTCVGGKALTRMTVIDALVAKDITVIGASFGSGGLDKVPRRYRCESGSARSGQGSAIAEGTYGRLVPSEDQAKLVEVIVAAIQDLPRIFDVDPSDCAGKLESSTKPVLPITLEAGESARIEQKLRALDGVCTGPKSFECQIKYTEGGALLPPTTVKVLDVEGCSV